ERLVRDCSPWRSHCSSLMDLRPRRQAICAGADAVIISKERRKAPGPSGQEGKPTPGLYKRNRSSVHHAAERSQRLPGERIARLDFQRFLEAAHGVGVHLFPDVRASRLVTRKMPRHVAARFVNALDQLSHSIEATVSAH